LQVLKPEPGEPVTVLHDDDGNPSRITNRAGGGARPHANPKPSGHKSGGGRYSDYPPTSTE
jgi:hypothetical protein